jgi:diguanylate cyclase (GGDEF)-like protein
MIGETLKRSGSWLPTVLVLAIVLLAGSRLVMLSLDRHAEDAQYTAGTVLSRERSAIETQLSTLAARASEAQVDPADRASRELPVGVTGEGTFRVESDGTVASAGDQALASQVAEEWKLAEAAEKGVTSGMVGVIRHGSRWIVAARAPVRNSDDSLAGWSVAWIDLDKLLSGARIGNLVSDGYDFTFSEVDVAAGRARPFASSGAMRLADPAKALVELPPGFDPVNPGTAFELAIRPRDGWYPASRLATEIGLLALLAWLLAFGTHDLLHRSQRLQTQLSDSKERQASLSEQLETEIDERQDLQKSFDHARYHDAFTGLPNRRFFMDQLDRSLREVRARRRHGIAVAIIDIDRFRLITETLGHAAGDELMVQAGQRFERAVHGVESVLARLEGSQFALLLFDVLANDAAVRLAGMLQECLHEPFDLRRHRLSITAHIGVTCADSGLKRAEDLLREADVALSATKRSEGVRIAAFAPSMGGDAASLVSLEADLHVALERNELRLLFQPIVDLRTGQAVGAEALLRWQHPVEGLLRPDKFLRIAEEAGLMVPITRWIIGRVCRIAYEWRQRLEPGVPFYLSINLSTAALRDPHLADYVSTSLSRAHAPASALKFEITESGLIDNVAEAREVLRRLHDMGIQLMLDDFGTGYSSLNHLELFPFDYVKIDRPFVSRIGAEDANRGIMAAVVQIASSLGLKAIAEVIETQSVAQALQQMGCDYGQRLRQPVAATTIRPPDSGDDSPTLVLPAISRSRT